jgi:hypothetical protein
MQAEHLSFVRELAHQMMRFLYPLCLMLNWRE